MLLLLKCFRFVALLVMIATATSAWAQAPIPAPAPVAPVPVPPGNTIIIGDFPLPAPPITGTVTVVSTTQGAPTTTTYTDPNTGVVTTLTTYPVTTVYSDGSVRGEFKTYCNGVLVIDGLYLMPGKGGPNTEKTTILDSPVPGSAYTAYNSYPVTQGTWPATNPPIPNNLPGWPGGYSYSSVEYWVPSQTGPAYIHQSSQWSVIGPDGSVVFTTPGATLPPVIVLPPMPEMP